MDPRRHRKVSKYLSKHLRHSPERLGLSLEPGGWVRVDRLLEACSRHGFSLTRSELEQVVHEGDKPRFSFDESGTRIRANYGHSVSVDLGLTPELPPPRLYHGTAEHILGSIRAEGLKPMGRHFVHLYEDAEAARAVGGRHGTPRLLVVDSETLAMRAELFYRGGAGIWLVRHVPPELLSLA